MRYFVVCSHTCKAELRRWVSAAGGDVRGGEKSSVANPLRQCLPVDSKTRWFSLQSNSSREECVSPQHLNSLSEMSGLFICGLADWIRGFCHAAVQSAGTAVNSCQTSAGLFHSSSVIVGWWLLSLSETFSNRVLCIDVFRVRIKGPVCKMEGKLRYLALRF